MAKRTPSATERHGSVRRLTISAAILAAALNAVLFIQTSALTFGAGSLQDVIVSVAHALFPGDGIQPAPVTPVPGATPIAVTGGS